MPCLKIAGFTAIFGFVYVMTSPLQAAVPLTDNPQQQPEPQYLKIADSVVEMNGRGMLNGYKGYRHHRPGYRRHSDKWWYPIEAFEVKKSPAQKGETETEKRNHKALPERHVRWCMQKYLSYRVEDNTFQPYDGPRKTCHSSYLRKD